MSYDLSSDGENVPGPPYPGISATSLRRLRNWSAILVGLVFLFLFLWWLVIVYTDWLWFGQVAYRSVFAEILLTRSWLFAGAILVSGGALWFNLSLVWRYSRGQSMLNLQPETMRLLWALAWGGAGLTVLIASPVFGAMASDRWEVFLLFLNRLPFGMADPQFGLDATFYIVTLRMLNFIQGWFLGLMITVIITSLVMYFIVFSLRGVSLVISPRMLRHFAMMGLALMVVIALGHALDVYGLTLSDSGVVHGATYTDVHARIPALWFLTGIALLAAVGFGVSYRITGLRLMLGAFSLWVALALLGGLLYPALFQRLQVAPDEFTREEPFIQRNLDATRFAYQLDRVEEIPYPATGELNAAAVQSSRLTLDNIRLWDLQPLLAAYNQLQFMELYYNFLNMDSDRYRVDGRLRQVLVGARELDSENLPTDARNWVNQRLQYTHGYGVVMSPATGFTPGEGRPEFFIQDIPIRGRLEVQRPELYYGENPISFAIVNSSLREVDPNPAFEQYTGDGGVPLSSYLRKLAYAWRFGDINILLSDQVVPESRIQYRRHVGERVGAIAPFLKLDRDPYPVLDESGKLWWIQDAYTVTDRYPYSTPLEEREFNYVRNSVKAVVDAYNGDVYFYVVDGNDPLLQMWRRAFPLLFQDIDQMPPALLEHIRYPVSLFSAQAQVYLRYHVTDPQVFFNQAQQWAIPLETRFGKQGVQVTPSYLVTQLPLHLSARPDGAAGGRGTIAASSGGPQAQPSPSGTGAVQQVSTVLPAHPTTVLPAHPTTRDREQGQTREEFVLLLPLTPAGDKKNLVGWLAARNDWPNYGQLVSFQLPDDHQIDGPSQVEARIENDQRVSQQFTLWDGSGSEIIRGQLLVLPIADTIIYVEPLYLQSSGLAFPELKKVILADDSNLVMADTIDQGLALLVGDDLQVASGLPAPTSAPGDGLAAPGAAPLPGQAIQELEQAVAGLGDSLEALEQALENLRESLR